MSVGRSLSLLAALTLGVGLGLLGPRLAAPIRAALAPDAPPSEARRLWPRYFRVPEGAEVSEDTAAQLEALGYATGYEAAKESPSIALALPDAQGGLSLYTSGHGPEARLIDARGRALHRWHFEDPEVEEADREKQWWRRVRLAPDGALFAIRDWHTLYKLDVDSNLVWRYDGGCHHDLDVTPDGEILVLGSELRTHPFLGSDRVVTDDVIVRLSADGRMLDRLSLLDALVRSDYASLLLHAPDGVDVLHTNRLRVLDGRLADLSPAFAAGNLLVSFRQLDAIAVVDPDAGRVVWALTGMWRRQHDPSFVDDGHLLVFDNLGAEGRARVIEVDSLSQEVVWRYPPEGSPPIHSDVMGSAQRLEGGNTLIVESTRGRAFEVTPDGRVVWDFRNPERAGSDREMIATLPDLHRLPPGDRLEWLPAAGS